MSIKENIRIDLTKSMKEGNRIKAETLRSVIASITVGEKANGTQLEDSEIIKIFSKMVKDRKTSIELFEKGNRKDLVDKEQNQINILESYLPKAMSNEEITSAVMEIVKSNNFTKTDMGKIMKEFNSKYAGKADGKTVSDIIKSNL